MSGCAPAVRPGREHDTTCARTHPGLLDRLTDWTDTEHTVLADLGYRTIGPCRVAQLHVSWRSPTGSRQAHWTDEVQDPRTRLYPTLQQLCVQTVGDGVVVPWRSGFLLLLPATVMAASRVARRRWLLQPLGR